MVYRMEENLPQLYRWHQINAYNTQRTKNIKYQKKQSINKWAREISRKLELLRGPMSPQSEWPSPGTHGTNAGKKEGCKCKVMHQPWKSPSSLKSNMWPSFVTVTEVSTSVGMLAYQFTAALLQQPNVEPV